MSMLTGSIPGQSLTTEPENAPWEQPPLYSDVQTALAFHLKHLSDPDIMEDAMFLLEQDFPLNVLVESITSAAVMQGYHTIDVSTLINPVLHEYLKTMAEAADIPVTEFEGPTNEEKGKLRKKKQFMTILQKTLPDNELAEEIAPALGMSADQPVKTDEEQLADMEPKPEEKPNTGLIPRRQ